MAIKGLFFNALPSEESSTGYDRNYNADDISNWLAAMFDTGVVKDGMEVEAAGSASLTGALKVNAGRAAINGKGVISDSAIYLNVETAPTSGTRYDYVVLKYDNSVAIRNFFIEYREGTNSIPTVSNLTRSGNVYELMLCYVEVNTNVTTIAQSKITDLRGDTTLCPWFTAVKGYEDYYDGLVQEYTYTETISAAKTTITTDLASSLYNTKFATIEVYTNGIRELDTAYTINATGATINIVFTALRGAGAVISVKILAALDGENLPNSSQLATLTSDVATLEDKTEYTYICNGSNDNVAISNLIKAFRNASNDYSSLKLNIVGTFGYTAMANGAGTSSNPYSLFDIVTENQNRQVTLDFTNCSQITVTVTNGTYNIIFNNGNINVVGLNLSANAGDGVTPAAGTTIRVFHNDGRIIKCDNCRFWLNGYANSFIGVTGTFNNCRGSVSNLIENTYCFQPYTNSILRVNGGEYYAYTAASNKQSAVVGQSAANAVSVLYGVNAPTAARAGFYQTNSLLQWSGGGYINCTDLISNLTMVVVSGISNIRGTIPFSKAGAM